MGLTAAREQTVVNAMRAWGGEALGCVPATRPDHEKGVKSVVPPTSSQPKPKAADRFASELRCCMAYIHRTWPPDQHSLAPSFCRQIISGGGTDYCGPQFRR
jgi:hypothetical protein